MTNSEEKAHYLFGLWQKIKNVWIQDIPEGLAACEFDCHESECRRPEGKICNRYLAKPGEAMQVKVRKF